MISKLKPYPAYKDSGIRWLGEIPENWEVQPTGAAYKLKLVKNSRMTEKTVLSLSYGRIIVKEQEKLRGLVPESFESYQIVDPGNIIVRATDLQNDQKSLRIGFCKNRGIITSAYLCLEATEKLLSEFAYQMLNTYDLLKIIYSFGSGLRQNLDFHSIKRMPVLVPQKPDQAAIVSFLDTVDRRIQRYIRTKKKIVALLNEQKEAIIHCAVTQGLNPNPKLKPLDIEWLSGVPEHWAIGRLKDVAVVQTGLTLGKNYRDLHTVSRPYLRVANVQHGRVNLKMVKRIEIPAHEAARATLQPGDVLMTEGGDIDKLGRGCVWYGEITECLHQNHVFAVRCRPGILLPEFLVGLMASRHGRAYFQTTAKQTTNLASTNSSTLRAFPILIPPIPEQQEILHDIARQTAKLDLAMTKAKHEIDLLREYHTRLIADVVTGKLDVREATAQLPEELEESEPIDESPETGDEEGEGEDLDAALEEDEV